MQYSLTLAWSSSYCEIPVVMLVGGHDTNACMYPFSDGPQQNAADHGSPPSDDYDWVHPKPAEHQRGGDYTLSDTRTQGHFAHNHIQRLRLSRLNYNVHCDQSNHERQNGQPHSCRPILHGGVVVESRPDVLTRVLEDWAVGVGHFPPMIHVSVHADEDR